MAATVKPLRWTVFLASQEFHKTGNHIREGLRNQNISAGSDGKYSTQDIARAIYDRDALEVRAKQAKWQSQIDSARIARDRVKENERRLVDVAETLEMFADIQTTIVQVIRHSRLTQGEKDILVQKIMNAPNDFKRGEYTTLAEQRKANPPEDPHLEKIALFERYRLDDKREIARLRGIIEEWDVESGAWDHFCEQHPNEARYACQKAFARYQKRNKK